MRFKGLDLNLIHALDVLLDERSVAAAAVRLNLTQPAVSAALARLRVFFGDPLLIRAGRGMIPTALAEELRPLARELMRDAARIVRPSSGFDPASSRRRFAIGTSDYIVTVLIAPLLARLEAEAPGIRLDVFPTGPEVNELLDRGDIDLIVGPETFLVPGAIRASLFEERHVVVGWKDNPAMQHPLTEEGFLALGHVAVRIGVQREPSFAEGQLAALGDRRRIEVTTTGFATTPQLLVGTSRVAVLQERLAALAARTLPLVSQPLPFPMAPLRELVQINATRRDDAGVQWLIDQLRREAA